MTGHDNGGTLRSDYDLGLSLTPVSTIPALPFAEKPGTAFPRVGQLVWVEEEGHPWPGITVKRPPLADTLEIVLVSGATLRRKTVSPLYDAALISSTDWQGKWEPALGFGLDWWFSIGWAYICKLYLLKEGRSMERERC